MRRRNRYALTALTGISLLGVATACASTSQADPEQTSDSAPSASSTPDAGSTPSSGATYANGTYTESGSYQSPAGTDTVKVTITLASDVVTAVKVRGSATDPSAKRHQAEFISGISSVVVGKKIDSLKVSKVSGSSLTSDGFNAALAKIRSDARA